MKTPMRIMILDDEIDLYPRSGIKEALKGHHLTLARSFREAKLLYAAPYDLLCLDHDMEGRFEQSTHHNTGWRFCEWLINEHVPKVPTLLHSQNDVGRRNMFELLNKFGWRADQWYFGPVYLSHLKTTYPLVLEVG